MKQAATKQPTIKTKEFSNKGKNDPKDRTCKNIIIFNNFWLRPTYLFIHILLIGGDAWCLVIKIKTKIPTLLILF